MENLDIDMFRKTKRKRRNQVADRGIDQQYKTNTALLIHITLQQHITYFLHLFQENLQKKNAQLMFLQKEHKEVEDHSGNDKVLKEDGNGRGASKLGKKKGPFGLV